ncbi:MAG: hypothetical protein IKD78_03250, partial [Bacteroidales bacterium]|nr:hypothetical protein [Bacteroidales bacterium]
ISMVLGICRHAAGSEALIVHFERLHFLHFLEMSIIKVFRNIIILTGSPVKFALVGVPLSGF